MINPRTQLGPQISRALENQVKVQIKHRYTDAVLFEADVPDDTPSGLRTRVALEKATAASANLRSADLYGADLRGADLGGANLYGANLGDANLNGANLYGADLRSADLNGKKLIGERPFFQVGPIGSRADYFTAFITDAGLVLRAGCFTGTVAEFEAKLQTEHGDNAHAKEYRAALALALIAVHAELWTPTGELND